MLAANNRLLVVLAVLLVAQLALGQRDNDNDDFDDSGFDDSGYNSPQSHDAEGSNQNPSNYQSASDSDDLDDDDDVDETHVSPQVAPDNGQFHHQQQAQPYYNNVAPQRFYSTPNSVMLANVDPSAINYNGHQLRYRRSIKQAEKGATQERDIEDKASANQALIRHKRHSKKYIGPVYTYVKTDKHARYKWGVKHKVGKHYG